MKYVTIIAALLMLAFAAQAQSTRPTTDLSKVVRDEKSGPVQMVNSSPVQRQPVDLSKVVRIDNGRNIVSVVGTRSQRPAVDLNKVYKSDARKEDEPKSEDR